MKKRIGILGVLIAILVLGVGYAAITSRYLYVRGSASMTANEENFDVIFKGPITTDEHSSASIDSEDSHIASIEVTGLTGYGQSSTVVYTIENVSNGLGAILEDPEINIEGAYRDYFDVTTSYGTVNLNAPIQLH